MKRTKGMSYGMPLPLYPDHDSCSIHHIPHRFISLSYQAQWWLEFTFRTEARFGPGMKQK
jgi:hypothetical protein